MKCFSCGKELADDAKFCLNCGARQDPELTGRIDRLSESALEEAAAENSSPFGNSPLNSGDEPAEESVPADNSGDAEGEADAGEVEPPHDIELPEADEIPETDDAVVEFPHDIELPEPEPVPVSELSDRSSDTSDTGSAVISGTDDKDSSSVPGVPYNEDIAGGYTDGPVFPAPSADDMGYQSNTAPPVQPMIIPTANDADEDETPVPAEDKKRRSSSKLGAGRYLGAGFVSLFAVIFLIITSLLFCVKMGASGELIRKRIEGMELSTVLDGRAGKKSLSDTMYSELGIEEATGGAANKYSFREFMGNTDLLGFAGEKAEGYAEYILNGSDKNPSVTVNGIVDFLSGNSEAAKNAFNYELQASDYNSIRSRLESRNAGKYFSVEEWSRNIHFNLANASYIFSYITIGILLALVLVLLIWIAVITDKKGRYLTGFYGGIFTWSGAIVLLCGIAAYAGSAIANVVTGQAVFYISASVLLPFALFAAATGAFQLVLGFIFRKIRKALRTKQKRSIAVEKALAEHGV